MLFQQTDKRAVELCGAAWYTEVNDKTATNLIRQNTIPEGYLLIFFFDMENIDGLITIVEMLALPLVILLLLVLFFVFVIRPFFAFLFDYERIKAVTTVNKVRQQKKVVEEKENEDGDDPTTFPSMADNPYDSSGVRGEQGKMRKMADSDPGKAGELVRQWLKNDRDQ